MGKILPRDNVTHGTDTSKLVLAFLH